MILGFQTTYLTNGHAPAAILLNVPFELRICEIFSLMTILSYPSRVRQIIDHRFPTNILFIIGTSQVTLSNQTRFDSLSLVSFSCSFLSLSFVSSVPVYLIVFILSAEPIFNSLKPIRNVGNKLCKKASCPSISRVTFQRLRSMEPNLMAGYYNK